MLVCNFFKIHVLVGSWSELAKSWNRIRIIWIGIHNTVSLKIAFLLGPHIVDKFFIVDGQRLTPLSSLLRVWPFPSHNLSGQLLDLKDWVQLIVYSVIAYWYLKKLLYSLAKPCSGEENTHLASSNNCTGQAVHVRGLLIGKDNSYESLW